jgi:hypothetical protein
VQIRFAVLTILLLAAYGCATESQPQQPGAAAAPVSTAVPAPVPASQSKGPVYRTGSRLPPLDDDVGTNAVSGVSKDDYMHEQNAAPRPLIGQ